MIAQIVIISENAMQLVWPAHCKKDFTKPYIKQNSLENTLQSCYF